ncbi:flavodoxin FldA [Buchnera aphidicola (Taiwanaphis decaspermi)]|uniref:flavodoxin FldA n=1 Tax=Buchnera aphidicola TaxID=9 RepID=UPI0031B7F73F
MIKMGIFFGSDTGNTEKVSSMIFKEIKNKNIKIFDISNVKKKDFINFDSFIIGIPTWYYGELQCDWDDFLPKLKKIDFKNKKVAIFGCGDQEDYSEYFCDAIGIIYNVLYKKKANIYGLWSAKGYNFTSSKALFDKSKFFGLVIDEDRQSELTHTRIKKWIKQLKKEGFFKKT